MTTTESETETVAEPLIDEATLDRLMAQVSMAKVKSPLVATRSTHLSR